VGVCAWIVLLPDASRARIAFAALATSYADEFSQLYQAPWINAIRAHPLGHMVLGSTFSVQDLAAYTAGVGVGVCIDWMAVKLSASTFVWFGSILPARESRPRGRCRR
jgi:hypothetical protein